MSPPKSELRALIRQGLSKSVVSLLIKVATAGLTYLMYVVLSRTMGAENYGYFAFGLSLATLLSIGASLGQQTAILRYWQEDQVAGRPDKAMAALGAGGALTTGAGLIVGLVLALLALVGGPLTGQPFVHIIAAALLVLPMALAEYWSSALRAQGSVWTALTPRDILWRTATPLVVVGLAAGGLVLTGWQALVLTAALLALALGLQFVLARRRSYRLTADVSAVRPYWRERGRASRSFFLGTLIDSAALNMDTIFIGLMVAAASAGVYFNAFRTAGLLTLFTYAITLVVAPMVSRHFHAGEMKKAQAITALCAWAGFVFSLATFVGFALFGHQILSLFGDHGGEGHLLLLVLSVGLMVEAATGPARIVMMMTGHERDYVRLFGLVVGLGIVVEALVIPIFGLLGAALVNAGARALAQVAITIACRRRIGIDPSLYGLFMVRSRIDRPVAPQPVEGL